MTEGFDVGLEVSGSPQAFNDMIKNMSHGGKISLLGIPSEDMLIDWNTVIFNMLTFVLRNLCPECFLPVERSSK